MNGVHEVNLYQSNKPGAEMARELDKLQTEKRFIETEWIPEKRRKITEAKAYIQHYTEALKNNESALKKHKMRLEDLAMLMPKLTEELRVFHTDPERDKKYRVLELQKQVSKLQSQIDSELSSINK